MEYLEFEAAVLGACLVEKACVAEVADFLRPSDFYNEQHREIYTALLDLWSIGDPISELTVAERLREKKKLKLAGGQAYLSDLGVVLPDVGNVEYYAKQVKDLSLQRNIRNIGKLMQSDDRPPHEVLTDMTERLVEAGASSLRSVPVVIGDNVERVCNRAINIYKGDGTNETMMTGMPRFDTITGGLKASDFIIIGARPSIGKSAFALHMARLLAQKGNRVLFFSLEMSSDQISTRLLAAESGVAYSRIQDGELIRSQPDILKAATDRLRNLPLLVDDKSGQSIMDIRVKSQRERVSGGVDIIFVDYIQIAATDSTGFKEVTEVSNGLKALAKDLQIPVVGLAQLSRQIENRDSRRPQLSDLKSSGGLEQDADVVIQMYIPKLRSKDELEVMVTKHRNGALGNVLYKFEKNTQVFSEIGGS